MNKYLILFILLCFGSVAQESIAYNQEKKDINHAVSFFVNGQNHTISQKYIGENADIKVFTQDDIGYWTSAGISLQHFSAIQKDGYAYKWSAEKGILYILALESAGAINGIIDLSSELVESTFYEIKEKVFLPSMEYRIIKFNLPWSPYRNSEATTLHYETCKDLKFWEAYLDMMVENHFNVLSLWNIHPFPFMIKAKNYPLANSFSDSEMEEWRGFWNSLFKMAKERGIQTFIVNWNIAVSPEFAKAYGASEYNDLSELVKKYTKESVTQAINEYPDLTGIGVTLADWMGTFDDKMNPQQREDWIEETFVPGMKEAKRPVKFLHRSVLAGDPMAMRNLLNKADLEEPSLVEIKFNWSHGHSTPNLSITHDYHSGKLDERFWTPKPENYSIQWMVRNEDFFMLNWGNTDFIRKHMDVNSKPYVNGYFIGSEGYIPAKDYFTSQLNEVNWEYAFQKQWLFYKTWGNLLYNQNTDDNTFINAFEERYKGNGKNLYEASQKAGIVPLRIASFYRSTWDYTLYSEGFMAPEPSSPDSYFDKSSPFISILELMDHETLDSNLLSIKEFVHIKSQTEKTSPIKLANEIQRACEEALKIIEELKPGNSKSLIYETEDIKAWAYLGLYFSDKLRAGVSLEKFSISHIENDKKQAIRYLEQCEQYWHQLIHVTKNRYLPVPHVSLQNYRISYPLFSWGAFKVDVKKDIQLAKDFH